MCWLRASPRSGRRLATLDVVADLAVLPVDEGVARASADIRVGLADAGPRLNVNNTWIAATALAHGLAVVTRDDDFDPLTELTGLVVVQVQRIGAARTRRRPG